MSKCGVDIDETVVGLLMDVVCVKYTGAIRQIGYGFAILELEAEG